MGNWNWATVLGASFLQMVLGIPMTSAAAQTSGITIRASASPSATSPSAAATSSTTATGSTTAPAAVPATGLAPGPLPVPRGTVTKHTFDSSTIYPGTTRDYWVYVPEQYEGRKPACVYVGQDGVQFNAPATFDQLIAAGQMPVTIGVFVSPGRVKALSPDALDRYNRSFEYDSMSDDYARFLLEELLPHVAAEQKLNLSADANDRCIGGLSSGAICAFTAAWRRPDGFSRVFSAIGTYVGLRGGEEYPTLIRKTEPKPIRVFLQDGAADQNAYGGEWFLANQEMESALAFAGYQVNHVWGTGGHNGKQATQIFPDAMRWLWKDWPTKAQAGSGSPQLREILKDGEGWKKVGCDYPDTDHCIASNRNGDVCLEAYPKLYCFPADGGAAQTRRIDGVQVAFGPDDRLYTFRGNTLEAQEGGEYRTIADGIVSPMDMVVRNDGACYIIADFDVGALPGGPATTEPSISTRTPGPYAVLWFIGRDGKKYKIQTGQNRFPGYVTLSTDQSLLYAGERGSCWVDSYQLQADGTPAFEQRFFRLHSTDTDIAGPTGLCVDSNGRLYVGTPMGVQVCDQAGRVNCIIPTPEGRVTGLCFGGRDFHTLYVACGRHIYSRQLKITGVTPCNPPSKPAKPHL